MQSGCGRFYSVARHTELETTMDLSNVDRGTLIVGVMMIVLVLFGVLHNYGVIKM
jgi:hypothetical protein